MSELDSLGGAAWFRLGDRDLATHLYRSAQRIFEGATKTEVTRELCERLGVAVRLLPVTNDHLATVFDTEEGTMRFQDYFVRHQHNVKVRAIEFEGGRVRYCHHGRSLTHFDRVLASSSLLPILSSR